MKKNEPSRRLFIKDTAAILGLSGLIVPGCGRKKADKVDEYQVLTDSTNKIDKLLDTDSGSHALINRQGCEVIGFRVTDPATGAEIPLLWYDSCIDKPESGWGGHATVMFPCVGGIKYGVTRVGDKVIRLDGHGFARTSMFEIVETGKQEDAHIRYRMIHTPEIRENFPFDFELELTYALKGNSLSITFEVTNTGTETMFCGFGWHPGLRAPVVPGKGSKADCRLVMPEGGSITRFGVNDKCQLTGENLQLGTDRPIRRTEEELDATMLFQVDNPALRSLTLEDPASGIDLRVDFRDFSHFGLWSEPEKEYICIEPSMGFDDSVDQEPFDQKVGVVKIEPRGKDIRSATITASFKRT